MKCKDCGHDFVAFLRTKCPNCGASLRGAASSPPPATTMAKSKEEDDGGFDASGFIMGMATGIPLSPSKGISTASVIGAALHSHHKTEDTPPSSSPSAETYSSPSTVSHESSYSDSGSSYSSGSDSGSSGGDSGGGGGGGGD